MDQEAGTISNLSKPSDAHLCEERAAVATYKLGVSATKEHVIV